MRISIYHIKLVLSEHKKNQSIRITPEKILR